MNTTYLDFIQLVYKMYAIKVGSIKLQLSIAEDLCILSEFCKRACKLLNEATQNYFGKG